MLCISDMCSLLMDTNVSPTIRRLCGGKGNWFILVHLWKSWKRLCPHTPGLSWWTNWAEGQEWQKYGLELKDINAPGCLKLITSCPTKLHSSDWLLKSGIQKSNSVVNLGWGSQEQVVVAEQPSQSAMDELNPGKCISDWKCQWRCHSGKEVGRTEDFT